MTTRAIGSMLLLAAAAHTGCTSANSSNTARTAKEQLLISNSVDQALAQVDFRPFRAETVFLEDKYLDCVDKNYIVASLRHRLLRDGNLLRVRAVVGLEEELARGFTLRVGEGFAGSIAAERRPKLLHSAAGDALVRSPFLRAAGVARALPCLDAFSFARASGDAASSCSAAMAAWTW